MGLVVGERFLAEHEPALFPVLHLPALLGQIALLLCTHNGARHIRNLTDAESERLETSGRRTKAKDA